MAYFFSLCVLLRKIITYRIWGSWHQKKCKSGAPALACYRPMDYWADVSFLKLGIEHYKSNIETWCFVYLTRSGHKFIGKV